MGPTAAGVPQGANLAEEDAVATKFSGFKPTRTPQIVGVDMKELNWFHHPMAANVDPQYDVMEFQIQIGSRTYPQYPVRSIGEAAYHLHKTLGMTMSGSTSIGPTEYRNTAFIAAVNLERAVNGAGEGASFSGESTIGGEMITLNIKNIPNIGGAGASLPSAIYVNLLLRLHHEHSLRGCRGASVDSKGLRPRRRRGAGQRPA